MHGISGRRFVYIDRSGHLPRRPERPAWCQGFLRWPFLQDNCVLATNKEAPEMKWNYGKFNRRLTSDTVPNAGIAVLLEKSKVKIR